MVASGVVEACLPDREGNEALHAPEGAALLLSAWGADGARASLVRPVVIAAWMAVLAIAGAALPLLATSAISSAAAL